MAVTEDREPKGKTTGLIMEQPYVVSIRLKNGHTEDHHFPQIPTVGAVGTFLTLKNRVNGNELMINKDEVSRVAISRSAPEPPADKLERLLGEVVQTARETTEDRPMGKVKASKTAPPRIDDDDDNRVDL